MTYQEMLETPTDAPNGEYHGVRGKVHVLDHIISGITAINHEGYKIIVVDKMYVAAAPLETERVEQIIEDHESEAEIAAALSAEAFGDESMHLSATRNH